MTRLYVPATLRLLADLHRDGVLAVGEDVVVAPDDSEETEYDALMTAADSSAVLAAELDPGERRRVVVVAEVASVPSGGHGRIAMADVVAVHADTEDLPADGRDPDVDLCWYATQEVADLLR
jgi:hypothetical protein